ncbi:protein ALP1-like [Lactuca sativa]|uniref:protein ALP1-like n=1 Tax=Lactuca sativa TaxID=4236 RepID=UPI0022AFF9ED|nr:protein ALP1-like [Lactuca sativa]
MSSSSSSEEFQTIFDTAIACVQMAEQTYNVVCNNAAASSQQRTRRYIYRNREEANQRLVQDYFAENATYQGYYFRRRFRMLKGLFERIVEDVTRECSFFQQRYDARGTPGFTLLQKCTAALRQLAYDISPDALDESFRMSARTARDSLHFFCKTVIQFYGPKYLRKPTRKLQAHHASVHGFPGMLGSLDCLHWAWENCPTAYHGQFTRGDHGHPTVVLEAVASQDMWIWHAFFGSPGSINDINVLNRSPIFNNIYDGSAPDSSFQVHGTPYKYGYYLVDGIYPEYVVFVKSFSTPHGSRRKKFKRAQERARKDVERAFGALKKRWFILKKPAAYLGEEKLQEIMYTCIILHNMIIEDEGRAICAFDEEEIIPETQPIEIGGEEYINRRAEIRCNETFHNLRNDLVEHIYGVQNINLNLDPPDDPEDEFSENDFM